MRKYLLIILLALLIPTLCMAALVRPIVSDIVQPVVGDLFGSTSFTPSDIPQAEADALIAFYDATAGDSWTDNTGWGSDTTVDNWTGVTVTGGHIVTLSLTNNNLIGDATDTLPDTLTTLDLGQNTGLTDINVTGLTALAAIDLAGCDFGQTVVSGILADIVTAGVSSGVIDIGGSNSAPEPDGVIALHTLEDDSWTLTYSTVVMENTGDMYAITADGDATIRSANLDLSGQTGKYIVIQDGAGLYATAYGHAADDAEALGGELITSAINRDAPYSFDTFTVSGKDISQAVTLSTSIRIGISNGFDIFTGKIIRVATISSLNSGSLPTIWTTNGTSLENSIGQLSAGGQSFNRTFSISDRGIGIRSAAVVDFGLEWSCKQLTALGTDALQLRDAATGSTRNLTSTESGFDPNTISKVEVFNAE